MTLVISPAFSSPVPTEVSGITPDRLAGMLLSEIERIPVLHGNHSIPLAERFHVTGSPCDMNIRFEGDLEGVHWIGAGMTSGHLTADGSVGRHTGSGMSGGTLTVTGSASGWAGAEMRGGLLQVHGSTGPLAGGAYRGAAKGMTGGTLLIHGDAGSEAGLAMRRGLIAIRGACQDFPAFNMLAGALFVFGNVGLSPGAGMRRGTLALLGNQPVPLLPTFRFSARLQPTAFRLVLRRLERLQFPIDPGLYTAPIDIFRGDLVTGGKGELLRVRRA